MESCWVRVSDEGSLGEEVSQVVGEVEVEEEEEDGEVGKDKIQCCFNPIKAIFQSLDPSALPPVIGLEFLPEIGHQRTRQLEQKLIF